MTLRDWARASGTCRQLYRLPLSVMRIGDPAHEHEGTLHQGAPVVSDAVQIVSLKIPPITSSCDKEGSNAQPAAGWEWASKRWSAAHILHLQLNKDNAMQLAGVCEPPMQLQHLKELHFCCKDDACVWWRLSLKASWLLSRSPRLEALSCRVSRRLFYFPPLTTLKHLMLSMSDFSSLDDYLPQLPALESLHLDARKEPYQCGIILDDKEFYLTANLPALDLRDNIRLTHVAFQA
jgi:hypothetical protein